MFGQSRQIGRFARYYPQFLRRRFSSVSAYFSGLALLAKIGDAEANQQAVIEDLHESQYLILSHSLCVPDTPIIIFSLEVLYKLSLLGEQQSSLIAQSGSNIGKFERCLGWDIRL